MKGSKRTIRSLFCMGLLGLIVCSAGCRDQEDKEGSVAWINEEPIPFSAFWDELKSRYNEVADPSSPQKDVMQPLKKEVLSDLIREKLLLQEASKRGITVSEEELDASVEEHREGYTGSAFQKNLMIHGKGYEPWRQALRNNLILEDLFWDVVRGTDPVSDETVRKYYDENKDAFLVPETVHLKQIVVKDRSLARSLRKRLVKGEAFGALASEYSIAPEKEQAGDLGTFRKGELPEELEKAAFSTPVGKVSSVMGTRYGYHLLKVKKKTPTHTVPFEAVRDRIARELLEKKQEDYYRKWVKAEIRKADIRVHGTLKEILLDREPIQPLPTPGDMKDEPENEP